MGQPICHFEVVGEDPATLRRFYGDLFDWTFETGDATTDAVSEPGTYGFVSGEVAGINGGVGGGSGHEPRVLVYVNVPDVEAALVRAERLGGTRLLGPAGTAGALVIGQFVDPEGNVIGLAGDA